MAQYESKCSICGKVLTGDSMDTLVTDVATHLAVEHKEAYIAVVNKAVRSHCLEAIHAV